MRFLLLTFFDHKHDEHPNLVKCKLLVCWKNDLKRKTIAKDGKFFIIVNGYEIEVLALDKIVAELRKKGQSPIMNGERPDIGEANKERFFRQLEENVDKQKFEWIKELYEYVSQREEFEVRWSGGGTWFSMRFLAKEWDVDPVGVAGDGKIWINYTGNPAINPWELPQETQNALRQLFKRKERWHTAPLNKREDLNKIKKAIEIIAENSKHLKLHWQNAT